MSVSSGQLLLSVHDRLGASTAAEAGSSARSPEGQGQRAPQNSSENPGSMGSAVGGDKAIADGTIKTADLHRQQPRGKWGDDVVNAYGDGQHRGSSSSGGARGYAWQGTGGGGRGFNGPPGNFIQGASGPPNPKRGGYRPTWGGKGGERKLKPPNQPQPTAAGKDADKQSDTKAPKLTGPKLGTVKALAQVQV
ncbi:hypothetical protein D1007_00345 [Hordeum vulgare]|nr:hypothetical protein D1007_00345 [Hordeum vulgare]